MQAGTRSCGTGTKYANRRPQIYRCPQQVHRGRTISPLGHDRIDTAEIACAKNQTTSQDFHRVYRSFIAFHLLNVGKRGGGSGGSKWHHAVRNFQENVYSSSLSLCACAIKTFDDRVSFSRVLAKAIVSFLLLLTFEAHVVWTTLDLRVRFGVILKQRFITRYSHKHTSQAFQKCLDYDLTADRYTDSLATNGAFDRARAWISHISFPIRTSSGPNASNMSRARELFSRI
jgi:hypothetical protein